MDATDKWILEILAQRADATATEISAAVNLSIPAVNKRIQRLRRNGVIRNFTVLTDGKKAGKGILAFVFLVLQYNAGVEPLMEYIQSDADVLECYAVTGDYDYIIKVCAEDVESLEDKILHLKRQKGVLKSHTMLSLMEHKFQPTILPIIPERENDHEA